MRKELGPVVGQSWIQGQLLPFPGCVTLEKPLHLSEPSLCLLTCPREV